MGNLKALVPEQQIKQIEKKLYSTYTIIEVLNMRGVVTSAQLNF